ncbi:hypothetical protein [Thermotalea metallivorans]|uniref:Uncharacterized protein n=1 Tax=Thermotalea metallivorans TaxID=520762 RepID=A0A140LEJ2_9FIRM|nr:hypothetical protein [Thermotalea metallivorans]KXG78967.1 hypothetical protein AN619_01270 [Thermotalea metallivorans]
MGGIDKNKLQGLMRMMGGMNINPEQLKMLEEMSNQYAGKSEEEIMEELSQLHMRLGKDGEKYRKQMEALTQIKDFLNEEQQQKLDRIMNFLNTAEKEE